MISRKKHYVVGSEGDAGGIVKRFLQNSGAEVVSIDLKLNNSLPEDIEPGNYLYIETPPKTHAEFILFGKNHGLKTFVEKPLVYSLIELTEPIPLFCNFNMEYLSIPTQHLTELGRYCKDKPAYLCTGDRGVILDLMPHLLSVLSLRELNRFTVSEVFTLREDGTDIFAKVTMTDLIRTIKLEVCYGPGNLIYSKYRDKPPLIFTWLPEESWWDGIRRFWEGETNIEKALKISSLIEEMYAEIVRIGWDQFGEKRRKG